MDIRTFFSKDLYHAYVVETSDETIVENLTVFLKDTHGDTKNIDFFTQTYDSFTQADSKLLKEWHAHKAISDGRRICIIDTKFITTEAQHALLKMLEEPQEGTHFFFVVPDASFLLDTVRSRVIVVTMRDTDMKTIQSKSSYERFVSGSLSDRFSHIATMIESYKDTEGSALLRNGAITFLKELEEYFYIVFKKDINDTHIQFVLTQIVHTRDYLSSPGASVKMILEHIALII